MADALWSFGFILAADALMFIGVIPLFGTLYSGGFSLTSLTR